MYIGVVPKVSFEHGSLSVPQQFVFIFLHVCVVVQSPTNIEKADFRQLAYIIEKLAFLKPLYRREAVLLFNCLTVSLKYIDNIAAVVSNHNYPGWKTSQSLSHVH